MIDNKEMILKHEDKDKLVYRCPVCGSGEITIGKRNRHQYGYCDTCDATYIHYIPLDHQMDVHKSKSKIKLLIGG